VPLLYFLVNLLLPLLSKEDRDLAWRIDWHKREPPKVCPPFGSLHLEPAILLAATDIKSVPHQRLDQLWETLPSHFFNTSFLLRCQREQNLHHPLSKIYRFNISKIFSEINPVRRDVRIFSETSRFRSLRRKCG